ncbi:MAG: T9SS type A sorting domain-containing protein [Saprospiraceae bacterium]
MTQIQQSMTILRLLLSFLFLPSLLFSQVLPDQIWLHGINDFPGQPGYGNAFLKFENGLVLINQTDLHMNFESTMAVMPDTLGNILFYTNGCHIANVAGDTMPNGEGINPGEMHDWTCPTSGYASPLGAMILQLPENPSLYYLFHMGVKYGSERKLNYGPFYYTVVDMSLDGGKGSVISKNNIVADGDFEPFTAVRHGNGRDWWLVFPEYGTNKYHRLLFSASGLQEVGVQQIGQALSCRYIGSSTFSPNGIRYARQQHCGVVAMDFDRCVGQFSNDRFMPMPPYAFGGGGVAFSKDGNRLLVSTQLSIQEADMTLPVSYLDTVVGSPDILGSSLHLMQYGPDGKIYLSNLGRGKFYHVINNPDDQTIGFQQRGLDLAIYSVRTLPNYPNYRLYDVPGSACDTLGINAPMVSLMNPNLSTQETIQIFPNPTTGILRWSGIADNTQTVVRIHNLLGKLIFEQKCTNGYFDLGEVPDGIYFMTLLGKDGLYLTTKTVVLAKK